LHSEGSTLIVTNHLLPAVGTHRGVLWFKLTLLAAALSTGAPATVLAQAPAAVSAAAVEISAEELEKLVGPIALYPDDLVAIILPAATNPLQIVQADRFLDARKANPKAPIDDKWDDSVKSLVNYPEVVKKMSADLDWTAALGEAVVADSANVLEAVQAFRRKAQSAGNLKTDTRQVVTVEKEVITIVPADPQVIYVPQYNPTTMVVSGGYSSWGYYAAPYPVYYYPYAPGAALATGLIWGAAIGAAWNGGRYATHYGGGNNNINIDRNVNRNTNINTGNINTGNVNRGGGAGGGSQWKSNKQPGQVSSAVGGAGRTARTGDVRPTGGGAGGGGASAGVRPATGGGGGGGGGASAGARPATGGGGGASAGARPATGGGDNAFQGYGSGHQTQMDSSRGAESRSAGVSDRSSGGGGGARTSSSSGGARMSSGGGGGGARGGGGGGGGRGGGGRR
jgi:hypothetical protein